MGRQINKKYRMAGKVILSNPTTLRTQICN